MATLGLIDMLRVADRTVDTWRDKVALMERDTSIVFLGIGLVRYSMVAEETACFLDLSARDFAISHINCNTHSPAVRHQKADSFRALSSGVLLL